MNDEPFGENFNANFGNVWRVWLGGGTEEGIDGAGVVVGGFLKQIWG